jgi:3alpha(or 20beta)-hydroxysteroid dehydrogenase
MKAVIEPMRAAGGGAIINISSALGLRGYPNAIAYAATKWAVRGMTKVAAAELASIGIRVNSIHPGLIDTPMIVPNTEEGNRAYVAMTPMKRIGEPNEVAQAVLFLASDDSRYITGAELSVDGGLTL